MGKNGVRGAPGALEWGTKGGGMDLEWQMKDIQ